MSAHLESDLERLLDLSLKGDRDAKQLLLKTMYERLRRLAGHILRLSFPRLERIHQSGSVLHETIIRRLWDALDRVELAGPKDFYSFSAHQIRRTLIDLARIHDRNCSQLLGAVGEHVADGLEPSRGAEAACSTFDPARLAVWTEFHERVESLPKAEREVVDLWFYEGLSEEAVAQFLGISQSTVSRLKRRAFATMSGLPT